MTKRFIEIEGTGQRLEISKFTTLKVAKKMLHLDELPDGTWRLMITEDLIPDFTKVKSFKIIREG